MKKPPEIAIEKSFFRIAISIQVILDARLSRFHRTGRLFVQNLKHYREYSGSSPS